MRLDFLEDYIIHLNAFKRAFSYKDIKKSNLEVELLFGLLLFLDETETIQIICKRILKNRTNDYVDFMDYVNLMILLTNYKI
jgi:hypothetical protein